MLTGSLVAYSVLFLVCYLMSVKSSQNFDFSVIKRITGDFDEEDAPPSRTPLRGRTHRAAMFPPPPATDRSSARRGRSPRAPLRKETAP